MMGSTSGINKISDWIAQQTSFFVCGILLSDLFKKKKEKDLYFCFVFSFQTLTLILPCEFFLQYHQWSLILIKNSYLQSYNYKIISFTWVWFFFFFCLEKKNTCFLWLISEPGVTYFIVQKLAKMIIGMFTILSTGFIYLF